MGVEGLRREMLTLHQQIAVEVGQDGGIEADAVLHEQDHLHAGLRNVVLEVHLVLDELDDGEYEVRIAQPAEHIVKDAEVLVLHAFGNTVGERSQYHTRKVGELPLHRARHVERIIVGITRHADDQVDVSGLQHVRSLLNGAHLRESRRIAQSQLHVFIVDLFFHTPVVFQHEGIIGVGHNEYIIDTAHHQVDKRHILEQELAPFMGDFAVVHTRKVRHLS